MTGKPQQDRQLLRAPVPQTNVCGLMATSTNSPNRVAFSVDDTTTSACSGIIVVLAEKLKKA